MILLGHIAAKLITGNTKRIAKGTIQLVEMADEEFEKTFTKFEKEMDKTGDYEIPNWFTIKFKPLKKNISNFIGTFHEGKDYEQVNKALFLEILKDHNIKFEKISNDEEIYRIIRH